MTTPREEAPSSLRTPCSPGSPSIMDPSPLEPGGLDIVHLGLGNRLVGFWSRDMGDDPSAAHLPVLHRKALDGLGRLVAAHRRPDLRPRRRPLNLIARHRLDHPGSRREPVRPDNPRTRRHHRHLGLDHPLKLLLGILGLLDHPPDMGLLVNLLLILPGSLHRRPVLRLLLITRIELRLDVGPGPALRMHRLVGIAIDIPGIDRIGGRQIQVVFAGLAVEMDPVMRRIAPTLLGLDPLGLGPIATRWPLAQ